MGRDKGVGWWWSSVILNKKRQKKTEVTRCTKVRLPGGRVVYRIWWCRGPNRDMWEGPGSREKHELCAQLEKASIDWPTRHESPLPAPKYVQDGIQSAVQEPNEANLKDEPSFQRLISISMRLSTEVKEQLVDLLKRMLMCSLGVMKRCPDLIPIWCVMHWTLQLEQS